MSGPVSHNLSKTRVFNFQSCNGLSVKCSGLEPIFLESCFGCRVVLKLLLVSAVVPAAKAKVNATHKGCALNTKFDHNSTS